LIGSDFPFVFLLL